ncbi:uncharacterized protein LACBIDRAFT_332690 [Laccaria bicolor S238N-H82]|uniref:Predicted protein n=1 Tax=Laccaria bicolor (strain S238N-H82 / ATCC MYA-4686) TaxID=486041 RepID=B0DTK1_LACBS|nr:uncharacterized protein LACBIDRAFT_332690 [Laccaria bicolor S238N-H82]EDR02131.1 predicted protein [Laccaria bicolor S238N-H82]|eukprot:XP_001887288.1 predicted protein [Laccaria bicolor S238N-H82]
MSGMAWFVPLSDSIWVAMTTLMAAACLYRASPVFAVVELSLDSNMTTHVWLQDTVFCCPNRLLFYAKFEFAVVPSGFLMTMDFGLGKLADQQGALSQPVEVWGTALQSPTLNKLLAL